MMHVDQIALIDFNSFHNTEIAPCRSMKRRRRAKPVNPQRQVDDYDLAIASRFYTWSSTILFFSMGIQMAALTAMYVRESPAILFWGPVFAVVSMLAKRSEIRLKEALLLKRDDLLVPLFETQAKWNGALIGFSFLIVISISGFVNPLYHKLADLYPSLTSRMLSWLSFLIGSMISGIVGNFAYDMICKRFLPKSRAAGTSRQSQPRP